MLRGFHRHPRRGDASELLSIGVDLRTVAGRLGHGSGGAITVRVYAAWVANANQVLSRWQLKDTSRPARRAA